MAPYCEQLKKKKELGCSLLSLSLFVYTKDVSIFNERLLFKGDPLLVGMDLTIASFDAISEVNMVRK